MAQVKNILILEEISYKEVIRRISIVLELCMIKIEINEKSKE
jgi:hypothetical protein